MKQKGFYAALAAVAALCVAAQLGSAALPGIFTAAAAFPFEQLGLGLRALSLLGGAGNAAALVLYGAVCLFPAGALLLIRCRRALCPEDALLPVLSAALFPVLYWMINPGLLGQFYGSAEGQPVAKAVLGIIVYSVLLGYVLLRMLRRFFAADLPGMQKCLAALLCALSALFVCAAFGTCFGELVDSIAALRESNTGSSQGLLRLSYAFLVLRYIVDALPYVLDVLVAHAALTLLREQAHARYSEAAVAAAGRLSRLCGCALAVSVLTNVAFNLLQLVFFRRLLSINAVAELPLLSAAFVLCVLLLSQYIRENKCLKDENDSFI